MTTLNFVKKGINIFNLVSILFLVFVLVIRNYKLQEVAYFMFFISYAIEIITDKKWKTVKLSRKTTYFLMFLVFFLLAFAYYPFESSNHYFKLLIEKRYPLLGFSIVGIFGVNKFYQLKYFTNTLVFTSLAVIFLIFSKINIRDFFDDPNIFNLARNEIINTHMLVNFYLNSTILGVWYFLSNHWKTTNIFYKLFLIASVLLFIFILAISEGRTGFLAGIFVSITILFIELWKKKKKYGIIFLIIIPWAAALLISTHNRMDAEDIKSEPRYFLWAAGWHVIKDNSVLGQGMSTAQVKYDAAREIYQTEDYKQSWIKSKHLDSHNQYLQTWMEFGIIGLVLLIYIYFTPLFIISQKRLLLLVLFIILLSVQSFFDMFITGYFSAFFCIWMLFLLRTPTKEERIAEISLE
jgi:O-antigen ligase